MPAFFEILLSAPGPKGFFQNPAYLLGIPLVALGVLGALMALSPVELRWPQPVAAGPAEEEVEIVVEGHVPASTYVTVGLILAVITAIEVAVYYVGALEGALLSILLILSALKFVMVALWFMHLRYDSPIFTVLFAGGMALVFALLCVVLATLGSSLV
jgi:cytochrome c oxidase subunit 4